MTTTASPEQPGGEKAALEQAADIVVTMTAPPRDLLGAPTAAMKATASLGERIATAIRAITPTAAQSQGAQAASTHQHEAIESAVDQCYPKQDSPHASVNDRIGAARLAFRKGYRAALAAKAEAPALTPLDYRAQGREEVLAIILSEDPENPLADHTNSVFGGEDYSSEWDEDKLRALLNIGDRKHDAYDRAEAAYWEALGQKDEAAREMLFAQQAPFYKPLSDFLSKHEAWDLMADLTRAQQAAAPGTSIDTPEFRELLAKLWGGWHPKFNSKPLAALIAHIDGQSAPIAPGISEAPFQARVEPWMAACFGPRISADTTERNQRFIEEALELVQAGGMPKDDVLQLVDYTFGRPVGELHQEIGGVMVTLAALCLANKMDMHQAAEVELARIWTKVEAIREKQRTKPRGSPLPTDPRAPQLDTAPEAPAADALDAARYRWLCQHGHQRMPEAVFEAMDFAHYEGEPMPKDLIDQVIDKERTAQLDGGQGDGHG